MASPIFTDVFAALVSVVNSKIPVIGDLLLRRLTLQLKIPANKPQLLASVKFIAHLVNQQVVHELIALQLLTVFLEEPTDDSVEVAISFVTECGSILQDLCPLGLHAIFERFRGILHEGEIDKRVQFLIENLFALRKAKFQGYLDVHPELDLVEEEDQLTHEISLLDKIDSEIGLDVSSRIQFRRKRKNQTKKRMKRRGNKRRDRDKFDQSSRGNLQDDYVKC
ncbi:pre-mRNA-splicing factor cwc22 [Datura stramonium]|uniref:Pre-mRNA-splicing factor cwc22 n=1 Tax=Datura stramonium TaxID=4076 RepID=A0ABS8UJL8_DATST|nr:pre-mRNA-splicing factor cwc22 [Datura stramonium]